MSWYDAAVKKLGFPTIELFVKVSDVVNVCVLLIQFTGATLLTSDCRCLSVNSFYCHTHFCMSALTCVCLLMYMHACVCVCLCRREVMGRPLGTVHSPRDSLWSCGLKESSSTSPLSTSNGDTLHTFTHIHTLDRMWYRDTCQTNAISFHNSKCCILHITLYIKYCSYFIIFQSVTWPFWSNHDWVITPSVKVKLV